MSKFISVDNGRNNGKTVTVISDNGIMVNFRWDDSPIDRYLGHDEFLRRFKPALVDGKNPSPSMQGDGSFQSRVQPWMMACFGPEISADKLERNDRFIEEALELVQASDYPKERAHALVDYVYGRDKGEINQEVGGVMVTLSAHCLAHGVDMHEEAEIELARIWTKVDQIREKQKAKPKHSPLPVPIAPLTAFPDTFDRLKAIIDEWVNDWTSITPQSDLSSDAGLDSLDMIEIIMEAEDRFDIDLDDADMALVHTVQDAVDAIDKARAALTPIEADSE